MTPLAAALILIVVLAAGAARAEDLASAGAAADSSGLTSEQRWEIENHRWVRASGPWGRGKLRDTMVAGNVLQFMDARPDTIRGVPSVVPSPLRLTDVDRLEVRVGRSRIGAFVFGALGAFVGISIAYSDFGMQVEGPGHRAFTEEFDVGKTARGLLVGGFLGAEFGVIVGAAFQHWKTIYRAPADRRSAVP